MQRTFDFFLAPCLFQDLLTRRDKIIGFDASKSKISVLLESELLSDAIKLKVASVAKALIWTIAIKQMIAKFL